MHGIIRRINHLSFGTELILLLIITVFIIWCFGYMLGTTIGIIGLLYGSYNSARQNAKRNERERIAHLEESMKAAADSIFHYKVHNGLYYHDVNKEYGKLLVLWSIIPINDKSDDIYQISMYFRPMSKKDDHIEILRHASWWRYCVIVQRFGSDMNFRYGVTREYGNINEFSGSNKFYNGSRIFPIFISENDYKKIIFSLGAIENSDELKMKKFEKNRIALKIYHETGRGGTFDDDLEIVKEFPNLVNRDCKKGIGGFKEI